MGGSLHHASVEHLTFNSLIEVNLIFFKYNTLVERMVSISKSISKRHCRCYSGDILLLRLRHDHCEACAGGSVQEHLQLV